MSSTRVLLLLLVPWALLQAGESLPEPGPENSGLRLRFVVTPVAGAEKRTNQFRVELLNVSQKPITLIADWPYEGNKGDFGYYVKTQLVFITSPRTLPFTYQTAGIKRMSPQPRHTIRPGESFKVEWKAGDPQLIDCGERPLPIDYFPHPLLVPGLYRVRVSIDLKTADDKTISLESNEQQIAAGGKTHRPKHSVGRMAAVEPKKARAEIDLGKIEKVEKGDRFVIAVSLETRWHLTIDHVDEHRSSGVLAIAPDSADRWKKRAPEVGMDAELILD